MPAVDVKVLFTAVPWLVSVPVEGSVIDPNVVPSSLKNNCQVLVLGA
jgi:hypothetical protein